MRVPLLFSNFAQWLFLEENSRERNRFQRIDDRVSYGKKIEGQIVKTLEQKYGWQINPVSVNQDKFDKIDGMVIKTDESLPISLPAPIQIKYRDTGNDLLLEVVKSVDLQKFYSRVVSTAELLNGRDMKGNAKIYASLDKDGKTIRIRLADEAKQIARDLLEKLRSSRSKFLDSNGSQIRFVNDPHTKQMKINAFINPNSFSWKKDYIISNIWEDEKSQISSITPSQILPKDITPQMMEYITKALMTGSAVFKMPNNAKKIKVLEKYVSKRGLELVIENGNVILRKKIAA